MIVDNSRASTFKFCPWLYYEQFVKKCEKKPEKWDDSYGPLEFGDRVHQLLEEHYKDKLIYPASDNAALEIEAQLLIAAYRAKYPVEEFEVVDVERNFLIKLPEFCINCYSDTLHDVGEADEAYGCDECNHIGRKRCHILAGKMDLVVRGTDGCLYIIDHKSEKRGAKSNLPQKWAEKDQASLYLWAAERIYGEKPKNFIVNVLTRQSPKGKEPPTFPECQKLERSEGNIAHSIRDLVYWADKIEECQRIFGDKPWPANRENCYQWGYCEMSLLHGYGEDTELIREIKYQPKREYLMLEGLPIIQ